MLPARSIKGAFKRFPQRGHCRTHIFSRWTRRASVKCPTPSVSAKSSKVESQTHVTSSSSTAPRKHGLLKLRSTNPISVSMIRNSLFLKKLTKVRVHTLVKEYLAAQELQLLGESGMSDAIQMFVEKDDSHAIST
ncbi:hypothetical protein J3R82DRAFT_7971 [Butyriboletus roseoflavus]|nr:hypothetical protein J3R82DRAFT_7971 [Butyriboletus roseoflavus]